MTSFVNDSALALGPWSGFFPCSEDTDCIISEATQNDIIVTCRVLAEGPVQGQSYCICNLGLGGEVCSIITEAAAKQIICFAFYIVLPLWPLFLGMWEIKERRKTKAKKAIDTVFVSLCLATSSMLLVITFGATILYTIAEGGTPGVVYVGAVALVGIFPLGIVTSYSSAMVISLDLLKIANDPALGGNWSPAQQKRVRSFAVATCVTLVLGYIIVLLLTTTEVAAIVIFICVCTGTMFSLTSGRQFNQIARSIVTDVEYTQGTSVVAQKFGAAITANRLASIGLSGTLLTNAIFVVVQNFVGATINADGFDGMAACFVAGVVFLCITAYASINFGRQVRLIQKPMRKSAAITALNSDLGSLFATTVVQVRPSRVAPGNA